MKNFDNFFCSPIYKMSKSEWVENIYSICRPYLIEAKQLLKNNIIPGTVFHSKSLINEIKLTFFHEYILEESKKILDHQGFDMTKHKCIIKESWVQEFSDINPFHEQHVHSNSHISGFFFIKSSENTSYPIFQDPRYGALMTVLTQKDENKITHASENIKFKNKPGDIIFFNSYLPHSFSINRSNEPFIFIHFNIQAI